MKTLLLKFAGPLQSWGTGSHFETRHTDRYPSKSAVVGYLGAGLGYRRNDDRIQDLNYLQYAVRVDQEGHILRDYQTAKKYKSNGDLERTYVTNRYYIEDAVFVVAIGSEDNEQIISLAEKIQKPYFQPYLGRRSLPPTADSFLGIRETDAIASLTSLQWQAAEWYQKSHSGHIPIYADAELLPDIVGDSYRKDIAVSFSNRGRKYLSRAEKKIYIDVIREVVEHDAFGALGE